MAEWIKGLMESMGYFGIVFLMILENIFPPVPSELIMPLAGYTAAGGKLSIIGVIIAGTVGSVLGSLPLFFIGRKLGKDRVRDWAEKHGTWLGVDGEDIDKSDEWFKKHGTKAVVIGRLVPGIRSLISLPAGTGDMNIGTFIGLSSIGALIWSGTLALIGRALGNNYTVVDKFLGPASYIIVGGIIAGMVWRAAKKKKQKAAA